LDFALDDARRLQASLGIADRRKLDEYLYAVRDIEQRLTRSETLEDNSTVPSSATGLAAQRQRPDGVPQELDEHCRLMLDMLVLAFQTDSTRVATFMFANEGSNRSHPQLNVPEGHHELSHHGGSAEKQAKIASINRFYVEQLAYFVRALAKLREGQASLLDNSLVLYGSGISDGDRHAHDNLPILLAGSAGGVLRGGQHLTYLRQTPLCNLYLWMMQQQGIAGTRFGDSEEVLPILSQGSTTLNSADSA
jgi:hypothetical protein